MAETQIPNMQTLGQMIRARRRALGLRQGDLAMSANVGIRFIVDAENGKQTCQVGLLLHLLTALDIKLTASTPPSPTLALATLQDDEMGGLEL